MILVTGGTGLVGSHLLYELALKGQKVKALIRPNSKSFQTEDFFNSFQPDSAELSERIEWIDGDIMDPYSLQNAMGGVDQVYHCAAMISFNPIDRRAMMEVNVEGTANVVNVCLEKGIKKLCHVSSIAALGHAECGTMITENAKWKTSKFNTGYSVCKYGGEREVWRGIEEGLNAVIVNPSVIIGAGCLPRAVNRLLPNIKKFFPFYTDGVNGYVDVHDVVQAMIMLMESPISAERYVLSAENLTVLEFFSLAADVLGKPHPNIKLNSKLIVILALIDEIRCRLINSRPLITRENVRSALSCSYYSSEKFLSAFNYSFIPISESLANTFKILEKQNR